MNTSTAQTTTRLIWPKEFEVGQIIAGIELSSGQIAKTGRFQIDAIEVEDARCTYLHNGNKVTFRPDQASRYEIQDMAGGN